VTALRFALGPGRPLTLAGAREAIVNWLFARRQDARFLLRIDDVEAPADVEATRGALEDLAWLGLGWDVLARQSERLGLYAGAAEKLKATGRLYQRTGGGRWYFKLERGRVVWDDLVRGPRTVDTGDVVDPPMLAADGTPLGVLASVIDDVEHEVSHVVRDEQRLMATAIEIGIFHALGCPPPRFGHLPALSGGNAGLAVARAREDGLEPMALESLLAQPMGAEPRLAPDALLGDFDLAELGAAPPSVDDAALAGMNGLLLRLTPFERIAHRLPPGAGAAFWDAVKPALSRVADVEAWWQICRGSVAPCAAAEDAAFLARAAELLPPEPLDAGSGEKWLARLRALTGRKDEAALPPLRLALTGRPEGPPLGPLLPLIGRDRAHARLTGKSA